jgi:YlmC/YmxH family sporulation protein
MNTGNSIRGKEVINVADGRKMGSIDDMEFTGDGHIKTLSVPGPFSFKSLLKNEKCELVIPWEQVVLIGVDVILVDVGCEAADLDDR